MIREVFIGEDRQQIDIDTNSLAGYIFTSPIFRDISKIISNRTTTYKIPKTARNLAIFGLADNPEIDYGKYGKEENAKLAPYRMHAFEEWRDGLPFIKGKCRLLKSGDKDLELVVYWGVSEKLKELKELNLRDLRFKDEQGNTKGGEDLSYITWSSTSQFLTAGSDKNIGFLKVDYGAGVDYDSDQLKDAKLMEYTHPCVNLRYILDLIESSEKIKINYDQRYIDIFKQTWIPLVDKTANNITWGNEVLGGTYYVKAKPLGLVYRSRAYLRFENQNTHDWIKGDEIEAAEGQMAGIVFGGITLKSEPIDDNTLYEARFYIFQPGKEDLSKGEVLEERIVSVEKDSEGRRVIEFNFKGENNFLTQVSRDTKVCFCLDVRKQGERDWRTPNGYTVYTNVFQTHITLTARYPEVQLGDRYPVYPNLPDMSVLDFLKSLMNMYGLFTHHNATDDADTIEFVSIDDMYKKMKEGEVYDWTDRLLLTDGSNRMKLEYTYGEYAQKNLLKYKNDKDVTVNANGYITVDNEGLEAQKDLLELPYSPSANTKDGYNNIYAKIPLYDSDRKYSSAGIRILSGDVFRTYKEDGSEDNKYKSAFFAGSLYFEGNQGLIKEYYSTYQKVLEHPVVAECSVYLSDVELHLFRENTPVYIDGVYYMPITVTVQTNGIANCKLIKMPYLEIEEDI